MPPACETWLHAPDHRDACDACTQRCPAPQKFNRWIDRKFKETPQTAIAVYPEGASRSLGRASDGRPGPGVGVVGPAPRALHRDRERRSCRARGPWGLPGVWGWGSRRQFPRPVTPTGHRSTLTESLPLKRGMLHYAFSRKLPVQIIVATNKEAILSEKHSTARWGQTVLAGYSGRLACGGGTGRGGEWRRLATTRGACQRLRAIGAATQGAAPALSRVPRRARRAAA